MLKKMFNDNINIVYKVFHDKIEPRMNDKSMKEDLLQIGMLSLWKCCINYDPERNVQFSTYAFNAIRKSMMCSLMRETQKTAILVSMSKQVNSEAEECPITYEDVIASHVNVASQVEVDALVKQLTDEIGKNSDKVISMLREGYTQTAIAEEINMSRSNVSKILKRFRKMLKNTLFFEE